ncbi:hypothetical protein HELRODRAFT_172771 [Helobdella robusta]|uniref:Uncharacterized protein n=1 Tax=Helobdella robusta TaxID=6412 RepID=T1F5X3_HELRO|nr:hypothetical protein HELRODRAFT_172771 [Helobdella robusta]ESO04389.1 hypothetical protein HELRODRAFT_172771 [Helobdella robusta]
MNSKNFKTKSSIRYQDKKPPNEKPSMTKTLGQTQLVKFNVISILPDVNISVAGVESVDCMVLISQVQYTSWYFYASAYWLSVFIKHCAIYGHNIDVSSKIAYAVHSYNFTAQHKPFYSALSRLFKHFKFISILFSFVASKILIDLNSDRVCGRNVPLIAACIIVFFNVDCFYSKIEQCYRAIFFCFCIDYSCNYSQNTSTSKYFRNNIITISCDKPLNTNVNMALQMKIFIRG